MPSASETFNILNWIKALALVGVATAAGELIHNSLSLHNLLLIYLLAVVLTAFNFGFQAAVLAAFAGTFAFYYFFIPSPFAFNLLYEEYLPTFLALFAVGTMISRQVATAGEHTGKLVEREAETASLYRLSRDIAAASGADELYRAVIRNIEKSIAEEAAIFLAADNITAPAASSEMMKFSDDELFAINRTCVNGERSVSIPESTSSGFPLLCLPLMHAGSCAGVLALRSPMAASGSQRLIEGFVAQTISTLQRIELAEEAEQSKILKTRANFERSLLNSVSHDLRTPLVSITGALSTLMEDDGILRDSRSRILLETALGEAERLNRFVGKLLDITRIEAGAITLNAEPCEVQELVGCTLPLLKERIGKRKITVSLSDKIPLVDIDLVLMTQVLFNLLENALKYTPSESGITISARSDASRLILEVTDSGPGIPDKDLSRIFDKFYRIPATEGVGGTGLGLSICRGIVEAHGGKIDAENVENGGLRIIVRLPLEKGR